MQDPDFAVDVHTYERRGIAQWLTSNNTSGLTKKALRDRELTSNHQLKSLLPIGVRSGRFTSAVKSCGTL